MTIIPDHPTVRDFLTLTYREMVKQGRKTTFNTLKDPMYRLISVHGQAALFSYQGFWFSLVEQLRKEGHEVVVQDMRQDVIGEPDLSAAMVGLLPPQRPWILKALENGNSGLLGAPTRFGKSYGMVAICRAFPKAMTVVTAPGVDLCHQLYEHFVKAMPHRDVRGVYTNSKHRAQGPDITICSIDSLDKMDPDATELLIVDEPHAAVSDERLPKVVEFSKARKYGFGATLNGRFDKKDRLIVGLLGPIISNVTYKEAVASKSISPCKVIMIKIPFSKDTVPGGWVDRDLVYKRLLTESSRTAALVRRIMHDIIPAKWQTMAFIQNERQAEFYMEHSVLPPEEVRKTDELVKAALSKLAAAQSDGGTMVDRKEAIMRLAEERFGTIAMAKRMGSKDRKRVTAAIADGRISRVLASNIYVQGVTFPDLKVVINIAGGGANTTAIQKPGRLLQIRPGKNYGVLIDFIFECRDQELDQRANPPYRCIINEGWARHNTYKEIGYDIEFTNDAERVKEIILGAYQTNQ